jgi:spore maturation protein CgeB
VALDAIDALQELQQELCIIDLRGKEKKSIRNEILEKLRHFKPDIIFTTNSVGLIPDAFQEFKIPYVSWWTIEPSVLIPPPSNLYYNFIIDRERVRELRQSGYKHVWYLPHASNPKVFKKMNLSREDHEKYRCDISFAGSCRFSKGYLEAENFFIKIHSREVVEELIRRQMEEPTKTIIEIYLKFITEKWKKPMDVKTLEQYFSKHHSVQFSKAKIELRCLETEAMRRYRGGLIKSIADFGIVLYGDSEWKRFENSKVKYGGFLDNRTELPKLYNATKINLGIQIATLKSSVTKRVFDIPSCGAFLLDSFREELGKLFKIGEEVEAYRDKDELHRKIQYYLKNQDQIRKIGEMGRRRVLKEHTFIHRMRRVIEVMMDKVK